MPSKKLQPRGVRALIVICAVCALVVSGLRFCDPYDQAERGAMDQLDRFGRHAALHPDIVFLPIDSASVQVKGQASKQEIAESRALTLMAQGYPFSREVYALAIERLMTAGAKAVVFDMLFPAARDGDAAFRAALDRYHDHVVIGSSLLQISTEGGLRSQLEPPEETLIDDGTRDPRVGYVNFRPDPDQTVRRVVYRTTLWEFDGADPAKTPANEPELFSLSAQAARAGGYGDLIPKAPGPKRFRFIPEPQGGKSVAYNDEIFPKVDGRVRPLSLYQIFVPAFWAAPPFRQGALFRNKVVFIGPYGDWVNDRLNTPLGSTLGPRVQISALNAILQGDLLRESSPWLDATLVFIAGAIAALLGVAIQHPLARVAAVFGAAAGYVGIAFLLFDKGNFCLALLSPCVSLLSGSGIGLLWERVIEHLEKIRIRRQFEGFVSRDAVKELLDNRDSYLHLERGARRRITVLFSDIRGFTGITESAKDPDQLVHQLNEYLTEMVRIVFKHDGTLDKFIGDAVMAHFGTILTRGEKEDACRAVTAGLEMLEALKRLNAGWRERGMKEWKIGMGINHGDPICALIGSADKHEITAIGDAVNLASRLESQTKHFHVDLLIGEEAARLVRDVHTVRTIHLLQVKGKTKPVDTFTVIDPRDGGPKLEWLGPYEQGVKRYREGAFAEATTCFEKAALLNPGDWLIQDYLRRCAELLAAPPAEDWRPEIVLTSK